MELLPPSNRNSQNNNSNHNNRNIFSRRPIPPHFPKVLCNQILGEATADHRLVSAVSSGSDELCAGGSSELQDLAIPFLFP